MNKANSETSTVSLQSFPLKKLPTRFHNNTCIKKFNINAALLQDSHTQ